MSDPIVSIKDFSYRYPRTPAPSLQDIQLEIHPGELVGVVGHTGAGKSTLCLLLSGLIPQVLGGKIEGQALLNGKDTATTPLEELLLRVADKVALVGLTLQDPEAQLVGMTVEEDIAFGLENLGLPTPEIQERVAEVLRLIRMEHYRFAFPYKLSGGQKQRIAIGSTMALQPRLLVLDEPTSELDPVGRKEVFSVIEHLRANSDFAIVVVEHHTEDLALFCDRVLVMNEGKIVLDGDAAEVFSRTELLRSVGVRPPDGVELLHFLHEAGLVNMPAGLINEAEIIRYLARQLDA